MEFKNTEGSFFFCTQTFSQLSGYDSHLSFEKLINKAIEKGFDMDGNEFIAEQSDNFISVKKLPA